jgi:hypothetical protein
VFIDRGTGEPGAILKAVIAAARRSSAAAVVVPTVDDLGRTPRLRWLTRFWLQRDGGLPVLVAGSDAQVNGAESRRTILPMEAHPTGVRNTGDRTRVVVDVVTTTGRAAALEFRLRLDTVEVWRSTHCYGVFDRDLLRDWLGGPSRPLVCDEVTLTLDRAVDVRGRVAVTLPGVRAWTFSEAELASLRVRV